MLVNWEPRDETVPQQDEYFNVTHFGAPKTKAAPAGYVPVNPLEITPNEKKLTKKDMRHLKVPNRFIHLYIFKKALIYTDYLYIFVHAWSFYF